MLDIHRKNTLEKSFYFLRPRTNLLVERSNEFKSLAYYVGWMPDEFLILKPSSRSDFNVRYPLYEKLIVRYLIANLLYSLEARVLYTIIEPAQLIFLEQPKHVEVLTLRKYERTGCLISAKVNIQSRSFDGIIIDISNYGMKIILDGDRTIVANWDRDMEIEIKISMLGYDKNMSVTGIGCRVGFYSDTPVLGIRFLDAHQRGLKEIDCFFEEKLSCLR